MNKLIENISTDFSGTFFHLLRLFRLMIYSFFSTKYSYITCYLKGVKLGNKCRFYGTTIFYRIPQSKIIFGNKCTFRSDSSSNLIGINRKCIISTLQKNAQIIVGNNCGFSGTSIGAAEKIEIGNNVICGANVLITDFDWHLDRHSSKPKPVSIEDNVWVGVNSVVLKGVNIGANSIIGANSLVVKDIPPNVISGGNPCKILKKLTD